MTLRKPLAALAVLAGLFLTLLPVPGPDAAHAAPGDSAVTVRGTGAFADLAVTVDQTRGLVNQTVHLSWTGGRPTLPDYGRFDADYLQIMQCWGEEEAPMREKCQFGALFPDTRGGSFTNTRQADYDRLVDPAETYAPKTYVPFHSVTGKPPIFANGNEFFDLNTTNEIPYARTRPNGTGEAFFEVQTGVESSGLGCGEIIAGTAAPRGCWLVVVPRSATEVDGSPAADTPEHRLQSSPLSASNWAHRLAVRLSFLPIGTNCAIGAEERRMIGHELLQEAALSWQRGSCGAGAVYGFSQGTDDGVRAWVTGPSPLLGFTTTPVPAADIPPDRPLVYAPVAVSGLVVAFNIERSADPLAPELRSRDGERITELKLTPRLMAKLLTQSYRFGAFFKEPGLEHNYNDMTEDDEFLDLNPVFRDNAYFMSLPDLLMPVLPSDAARALWTWINGDADARAFLSGAPDPHGMTVNKAYLNLELPLSGFPKLDRFCDTSQLGSPCTQEAHPYTADFREGAVSAGRGDLLAKVWDPTAEPPGFKKGPLQLGGVRAVLCITDAATAARYNLPVAELKNAAGAFVAPNAAGLLAGLGAMKADVVPNLPLPQPRTMDPAAYPLTTVTYAVVPPAGIDKAAGREYAAFLRYAVGTGQEVGVNSGQLPPGYLPLPEELRIMARNAANAIEGQAGVVVHTSASATPTGTPTRGGGSGDPDPVVVAPPAASAGAVVTGPASPGVVGVALVRATPAQPTGAVARYALASVLILGGLAAGLGPALSRRSRPPAEGGGAHRLT